MKRLYKVLLIILCITMLGGCGAKKLSSAYSEDKLKAASEEIINDLNNEKYDDVVAKLNKDLKKDLPASKLKEVCSNFKNLGKYDSISKIVFQEEKDYVVVISIAKYEKGKVQFTLSFNKNMELVGIYMK
ncbi:DUF3887 domain-containing protein [Clostridium thailandense]|uniref:DUF3887 domain-containing protein n=1 Tax=Clostridium thailandense TaxID=2794346 RepID=UPI0028A90C5A|nr:DUF3887 domain-containing protein [Clostridium thailandense]